MEHAAPDDRYTYEIAKAALAGLHPQATASGPS
jgi:hypothetical protein